MKVGVFFPGTSAAQKSADDLIRQLSAMEDTEAHGYRVESNWTDLDAEELNYHLRQLDLFVVVANGIARPSELGTWIYLVTGVAVGLDKNLCFVSEPGFDREHFWIHYPHLATGGEVSRYIREELGLWQQSHRVQKAREELIDLGVGLDERNFARRVELGDIDSVNNFLIVGFSPDSTDAAGNPLLVVAARSDQDAALEFLLEAGADPNIASGDRGNTVLMEAAMRGNRRQIRRLLELGANPSLVSKAGQTALMLAIGEGHLEVAKDLIDGGTDLDLVDQLGMTALKYATLFGHTEIVSRIEKAAKSKAGKSG